MAKKSKETQSSSSGEKRIKRETIINSDQKIKKKKNPSLTYMHTKDEEKDSLILLTKY